MSENSRLPEGSQVPQAAEPRERVETSSQILDETRPHGLAGASPPAAMRPASDFLAPPQSPDELGRLGGYRVLQELGAGGMGVVFLAEDVQLRRRVALKVMSPALAADAIARQRFLREAQAAAALHHDHIVTIYQVGEDRGMPFFAMELLAGESLEAYLGRERRPRFTETLRIGREIAAGLDAAHEQRLIHRDIKPANIWLETRKGQPARAKILDFGLAHVERSDARLTSSGLVLGTPNFMSPEQAGGEAVDCRGDLFSLGCVLYRMTTARLPFEGASMRSVLKAILFDQPPSVLKLSPDVPPALADLIARLLAKDARDRPESAAAVAETLSVLEAELLASPQALPASELSTRVYPSVNTATLSPQAPDTMVAPATSVSRTRRIAVLAGPALVALTIGLYAYLNQTEGESPSQLNPGPAAFKPHETHPGPALAPFDAERAKEHQDAWARHLGVKPEITNSIGMTLRLIPCGVFNMGSTQEEIEEAVKKTDLWNEPNVRSEGPLRQVRIQEPFYLGAHEVTVGDFRKFVNDKDYKTWGERTGKGGRSWDSKLRRMVLKPGFIWSSAFVAKSEDNPVVLLHREDVEAFCAWLSEKEGRRYRLPSEEQWEFACRAGNVGRWYWGDDPRLAGNFGWLMDPKSSARQMPVGSKTPNAFGLHDMIGNVAEFTLGTKGEIVMRGGHAGYPPHYCRSAAREIENHTDPTYRNGFRVLLATP